MPAFLALSTTPVFLCKTQRFPPNSSGTTQPKVAQTKISHDTNRIISRAAVRSSQKPKLQIYESTTPSTSPTPPLILSSIWKKRNVKVARNPRLSMTDISHPSIHHLNNNHSQPRTIYPPPPPRRGVPKPQMVHQAEV